MNVPFNMFDRVFLQSYLRYLSYFLRVKTVPKIFFKEINFTNKSSYKLKFPNTGLFSVFYACKYMKIKNLYIAGLDFYISDYIYRTEHASPLQVQHKKFLDLKLIDIFLNFIETKKSINFFIRSNYEFISVPKNLVLI